jgi:hypothetical protein
MNEKNETKTPDMKESGLFVSGIVVSSTARAFNRKDGSGIAVSLRHEIAYEGGLLAVEEFADPKEDSRVTVNGLQVVTFPQLKTFEPVRFRIERWKTFNNQLVVTRAVRIA